MTEQWTFLLWTKISKSRSIKLICLVNSPFCLRFSPRALETHKSQLGHEVKSLNERFWVPPCALNRTLFLIS